MLEMRRRGGNTRIRNNLHLLSSLVSRGVGSLPSAMAAVATKVNDDVEYIKVSDAKGWRTTCNLRDMFVK